MMMGMGLSKASEESNSHQLLQSQAHIWNHMFNFISSMSLKSAIELDIPDIINNHGGPMTLSELVEALPNINKAKSDCISRLMRILIHSGFFVKQKRQDKEEEEEGYLLTPASRLILKDDTLSVRPFVQGILDPALVNPWHHMTKWFGNDDSTPFETAHGRPFWDYMGQEPRINNFFNEAMASDSRLVINVLLGEWREVLVGLNSLVDVGGGTGTLAKAIAEAFPLMKCINFDLPHVVAGLECTKNLTHVEGDMFVAVPPADAVLLKSVMHNWSNDDCAKILKCCKEAIPGREKGGKLMIIDMVVEKKDGDGDNKSVGTKLFMDMQMMVLASGRERNEDEWARLFSAAGFSDYKITPILGLSSLIEVYP